jgi:hypothetical protein
MNRGEIRAAVKERLAIPSIGDGLLPDSTLNNLINRSLATISAAKEWPWLLDTYDITFVDGSAYIPNDFVRARQLVLNNLPVLWLQLEDFLMPDRRISVFAWTIIGSQARLNPVPTNDQSGTLYYYKAEPELLSDFSTPLMPALHHPLIVAYTAYLAAMVRQDEGRAAVYQAEYQAILNNMRDDLKQNTSRRIRYDSGYQYAAWS